MRGREKRKGRGEMRGGRREREEEREACGEGEEEGKRREEEGKEKRRGSLIGETRGRVKRRGRGDDILLTFWVLVAILLLICFQKTVFRNLIATRQLNCHHL